MTSKQEKLRALQEAIEAVGADSLSTPSKTRASGTSRQDRTDAAPAKALERRRGLPRESSPDARSLAEHDGQQRTSTRRVADELPQTVECAGYEDAREKACDLLARRPHTAHELRTKLEKREFAKEDIEQVITRLIDYGYIDESEIGRQRAARLASKGRGPLWIRQKLQRAGLSSPVIDAGVEATEGEASWESRAMAWLEKRGVAEVRSTGEQQKLFAKLVRRGFPPSIARTVVFDRIPFRGEEPS